MKMVLALMLFLMCGCVRSSVEEDWFVLALGFDYKDEYICYAYINDKEPFSLVSKGNGVAESLEKIEVEAGRTINYEHIDSIGMTTSFITNKKGEELIDYLKNNHKVTFSSNLFFTDDMNAIFSFKSKINDKPLFIKLDKKELIPIGEKTFIDFALNHYEKYYCCAFPFLSLKENISTNDEKNIVCEEVIYFKKKLKKYSIEEYRYIIDNNFMLYTNDLAIMFSNYYLNKEINDGKVDITVFTDGIVISNLLSKKKEQIVQIIKNKITEKVMQFQDDENDVLGVEDFLYRRGYAIKKLNKVKVVVNNLQ